MELLRELTLDTNRLSVTVSVVLESFTVSSLEYGIHSAAMRQCSSDAVVYFVTLQSSITNLMRW